MIRKLLALGAASAASTLSIASVAWASGNEHVIDDSVVETPGVRHLEGWATRFGPRHGLVNLSPACTRKTWPNLEIGGAIQHAWDKGETDATVGPALKYSLRSEDTGLGLGVIGGGTWSLKSGRLETASLIVPVTFHVNDRLRLNLNAGWSHVRAAARRDAAFYGAQVEVGVARDVTLMAETFRRDGGKTGGQLGVRWNPGGGRFDLDLVAGRRVDGETPRAVTLGVTVRR